MKYPFRLSLMVLALALAGCGDTQPKLPNVLIVSLDTTRADHLGCYGYERNTTPHLDALAAQATRYDRAYTTAPWTLPTHTSMFTGRFPAEHGMRHYKAEDGSLTYAQVPKDLLTLGEMFRELGYDTGAYVTNQAFLNPHFGVLRGFEYIRWNWMPGEQITHLAKRWLMRERKKPFFLFMNYMDAHYPYITTPVEGLLPEPPDQDPELLAALTTQVMGTDEPVDQALRQKVVDQYDTGLANQDKALGMLFDYLRENDLYDDMLIIVTSDHGEVFGEWRIVGHDKALYEPLMRAVMVVREPGQTAGAVNTDFVSSVDIPSFVLRSLPEEVAARYKDRFPYEPGNHPIMGERHFAIEHELRNPVWGSGFDGSAYMWLEWPWKLIHAPGGAHELYNLETDPDELDNAYARETARAEAMATALHTWRDPLVRDLSGEAAPIADPAATEAMEALGYL